MSPKNGYTIEVARSVGAVCALRNDWQQMTHDPNADLDFYLTFIESHSDTNRPHAIVLRQNGIVRSILVGRVEKRPLHVPFGYWKVSTPPLRFLTLIHGGVLGEDCEDHASLLVNSVRESLSCREADVAYFHGVDSSSALYRMARKTGSFVTHDFCPEWLPRLRLRLAPTYEQVYQRRSANMKHNLKRYSKRLLKAHGDQLEVRSFRDPGEVDQLLSDTEFIAKKTYLRGLGAGFTRDDQTHRLMTLAANQGWLRAKILYVKGIPSAFWNGLLYRRTFFTFTTGYDPDLAEFRPGMFLLQRLLEGLCEEGAADEVDFGFGDAQYKRDWCDYEQLQAGVLLFAPSLKGIAVSCMRTPLIGSSNIARSALARAGLLQKLKKAWRGNLAVDVAKEANGQTNR